MRYLSRVMVLAVLAALLPAAAIAQAQRPKLVVVLVVDQMRADYIDRYGHQWSRGLRRLLDQGAVFTRANYPYLNTVTCVGHATISTGAFPAAHGIIGNSWYDADAGRSVRCAEDPATRFVSYAGAVPGASTSAVRLLLPTLSDELRLQRPASRVVTFSMKDRTAVMLGGRRPFAATWFNQTARGFVTSSAFTPEPVQVIRQWIGAHPIEAELGKPWDRLLPASAYLFDDAGTGEKPPSYWGPTFPHVPKSGGPTPEASAFVAWEGSPASDAYLARMAAGVTTELKLGAGPGTDYLGISFTALDLVGHDFGPESHEVQDVLARLDVAIGDLLAQLDRVVGAGRYVVGLSGDHGVSPIPERMRAGGLPAIRVSDAAITDAVLRVLRQDPAGASAAVRLHNYDLYLDAGSIARLRASAALREQVTEALRAVPGVEGALFADALPGLAAAGDRAARAALAGYAPGRSGQIVVVLKPYALDVTEDGTPNPGDAASHGSVYDYDRHVPLILFGAGIRAGTFTRSVTPADMAPTLAYLCGVTLARPDGLLLEEAIRPPGPAATGSAPAVRK